MPNDPGLLYRLASVLHVVAVVLWRLLGMVWRAFWMALGFVAGFVIAYQFARRQG